MLPESQDKIKPPRPELKDYSQLPLPEKIKPEDDNENALFITADEDKKEALGQTDITMVEADAATDPIANYQ